MLDKVIAYENRLLQDRKLLNDLIAECSAGNADAMVRIKIEELQRDIDFMGRQAAILRDEAQRQQMPPNWQAPPESVMMRNRQVPPEPVMVPRGPGPMPQGAAQYGPGPTPQGAAQYGPGPMPQGAAQYGPGPMPQAQMHSEQKADLEKTIGKSVMGICASLLIFISLISFAVLILPYLSSTVKMVLMYAVSLVFAVTGILLLGRDKKNKWFLSLAGCGMGALYISLFMSCFYFREMKDITLYVCIFVWVVTVCVLSRLRSGIFLIIGQIGVMLSILLGICLCGFGRDEQKMLFLVIYSVLAETVLYVSHFEKKYNRNIINHISWCVGTTLLLIGVNARYMNETIAGTVSSIILVAVCCALILCSMTVLHTEDDKATAFGIFDSIYLLIAYAAFCHRFEVYFAALIAVTVLLVVLELRISKAGHIGKMVLQGVLFLLILATTMHVPWLVDHVSFFLFAAGCLVYGFYRKDTVYKIAGTGYALLFIFVPMNCWLHLSWTVCLTGCVAWLFCRCREQYRTWMKMMAYLMLLFVLKKDGEWILRKLVAEPVVLRWMIILAVLTAVNIIMMKVSALHKNIQTGEKERIFLIEAGAVQVILMGMALYCIEEAEPTWLHTPAVLLGGVVFAANSYDLLKKYRTTWPSIYVASKLMIFVIAALISYKAPNFIVSLAILVIALTCIGLGFAAGRKRQQNFKAIRIYGLTLAFLGMIKLILIDIHYGNPLMRTVGFFLSGIMCFAISLIYNMVDKQMTKGYRKNPETEQETEI